MAFFSPWLSQWQCSSGDPAARAVQAVGRHQRAGRKWPRFHSGISPLDFSSMPHEAAIDTHTCAMFPYLSAIAAPFNDGPAMWEPLPVLKTGLAADGLLSIPTVLVHLS